MALLLVQLPGWRFLALAVLGIQLDVVMKVLVLRHVVLQQKNWHTCTLAAIPLWPSYLLFPANRTDPCHCLPRTTTTMMGTEFQSAVGERIVADENAAIVVDGTGPVVARRERDGSRGPSSV